MRKYKSNQKKSFNIRGDCGTIDLVYRAKTRRIRFFILIILVFVFSIALCYSGDAGLVARLDGASKDILISGVMIESYDSRTAKLMLEEASAAKEEEVVVSKEVKELIESGEKSKENVEESTSTIKRAYLTFDDGPSPNTDKILDILDSYNIKGNFFVIGCFSDSYKEQYKRILDEGHVMGMHSYSHSYSQIYESCDAFRADLNHIQYTIYDITGYTPSIYRFPGGSNNLVSQVDIHELINILDERDIIYYDWNVNSGDADASMLSKDQIIDNVFEGIKALDTPEDRNEIMILFHDLAQKKTTVEALPVIIEGLQAQGYVIAPIDDNTKLIQHPDDK